MCHPEALSCRTCALAGALVPGCCLTWTLAQKSAVATLGEFGDEPCWGQRDERPGLFASGSLRSPSLHLRLGNLPGLNNLCICICVSAEVRKVRGLADGEESGKKRNCSLKFRAFDSVHLLGILQCPGWHTKLSTDLRRMVQGQASQYSR